MNEKEMLVAVKKAANVPADGWGVTWNPLYHPGHCAELIASHRVHIGWHSGYVAAGRGNGDRRIYSESLTEPDALANPAAAMRRAVCRAVIGGAA